MEGIDWKTLAARLFCLFAGGAAVFLALRYLLPVLLPFLIAWLLSLLVRPIANRIASRFHLSPRLCACILLVLFLSGSVFLLYRSVSRLLEELQQLLERLLTEYDGIGSAVQQSIDFFEALTSRIGFLKRIGAGERFAAWRERFNGMIAQMLDGLLGSLSATLPTLAGRVLSALPGALLVGAIALISAFYFCMDEGGIAKGLMALLPSSVASRIPTWRQGIKRISWKYVKAYLLLLLLTFAELFFGFAILRIEYAFLLAAVVALVDLLPVLGVGTVLVPWACVLLLQKNFYVGFGLLILYLATQLLRQIIEPRLVGKSLGLHPLLSLFASYAGWRWFGLLGMILGPVAATLARTVMLQLKRQETSKKHL